MPRTPRIRFLGTSAPASTGQTLVFPRVWIREPRLMVPGQKPIGRVTVNKADPIASQVILAWLATPALVDVEGRQGVLLNATVSTYEIDSRHGLGRDFGQNVIDFPYNSGANSPATILVVTTLWQADWKQIGGVGASVFLASRQATPDRLTVYGYDPSNEIRSEYTMPSGINSVVGKCDGTAVSLWLNGNKPTPIATGTWTTNAHRPRITLGGATLATDRSSSTYWDYPIFTAIAWNRALSDAECAEMSKDPYRLFIPA